MRGKLFIKNFKPYQVLKRTKHSDGRGSEKTVYTIDHIEYGTMIYSKTGSNQVETVANAETSVEKLSLYTDKSTLIPFDTVIRRVSDGKTYRITNDPTDAVSPDGAPIYLRIHDIEEFELDGKLVEA